MLFKNPKFDKICLEVSACTKCERMSTSRRVLNRSAGLLNAPLMFIGEAPGRLGADKSEIPFHGDKAGHNFEGLLDFCGLDRSQIYVTNSILCNPKDKNGNNAPPNKSEINNCTDFLKRQIELIDPRLIVTLGITALSALKRIERHSISLKEHVRTSQKWFGRVLIPLYHPGQRAMAHRSQANQRSDYQFVSELFNRLNGYNIRHHSKTRGDVSEILNLIFHLKPKISYFSLHKIFYLIEYNYLKHFGQRLTKGFFIRQKDGPYCTDLHLTKLKKGIPGIQITNIKNKLYLYKNSSDLFVNNETPDLIAFINDLLIKYGNLSDAKLKNVVYLTQPMRKILRLEKNKVNCFNAPIEMDIENPS